jgi:hypothetical protein
MTARTETTPRPELTGPVVVGVWLLSSQGDQTTPRWRRWRIPRQRQCCEACRVLGRLT